MADDVKGKIASDSLTTFSQIVMPNDANAFGNLMGGNLMRWMDIAGVVCASKHAENAVVTASVDNVSFNHPVKQGDVVIINAKVTRAFKTSVEVYLEVYARDMLSNIPVKTNNAYFTFVALDPVNLKPTAVKPVIPVTEGEIRRYNAAARRRELRLILAGRMEPKDAKDLREFFKNLD